MTSETANRSVASYGGTEAARQGDVDRKPEFGQGESELLASLRHDLRGPINHIIGYSEMLEEEARDRGKIEFIPDLRKIQTAGKQLLALTHEYLDAGRVRFDQVRLSQMRLKIHPPLNAIIGYSEVLEEEAKGQGQQDLAPDLQKICSAAKGMLAFMNDELALREIGDAGTSQLPSDKSAVSLNAGTALLPPPTTSGGGPQGGPGSVLVVDDNEMNRDMLSRRLERQGHTVAEAGDGRQALEMIHADSFDLVLLDIMMPEVDGYQVLEELKGDDTLRHVPVIMLSALDEIDRVESQEVV